MTDPRHELKPARTSGGMSARVAALIGVGILAGVVYVGSSGPRDPPPAPSPVATATAQLAVSATEPLPTAAAGAVMAIAPSGPWALSPWDRGLGIVLGVDGHRYPGQFFLVDDEHVIANYSVSDGVLGEHATLDLIRGLGIAVPTAVDSWNFSLSTVADGPPPMLIDQGFESDPADPAELAPAPFQDGFRITARLSLAAGGAHVLLIDITAGRFPGPPDRRYEVVAPSLDRGPLGDFLAPQSEGHFSASFGMSSANPGSALVVELRRIWYRGDLVVHDETYDLLKDWEIKLRPLRKSHGEVVQLLSEHVAPASADVATDELERLGYTFSVTGQKRDRMLLFSFELHVGSD